MCILRPLIYFFCIVMLILPQNETFGNTLSVIRDTQMEVYTIKGVKKLFKEAGLNTNAIQVIFINDESLNAFVAGGSDVYIHAGLILNTKTPDEFFGVLAHETGHVLGGHTIRLAHELDKAQTTALITTILGGVAAVASGRGDVGIAVMMGSMGSIQGMVSTYRQTEENAADSIAVDLIKKTRYSLRGLVNVMKTIEKEERLRIDNYPTYLRSHPLTRDRIKFLENASKNAPEPQPEAEYDLIKAKLFAFLRPPEETRTVYRDESDASLYANAIADFKQTQIQKAIQKTDALIEKHPKNPYFYELKGQILFESGQINESVKVYQKAQTLLPDASLIRLALAHALLETEDAQALHEAIEHLEYITATDKLLPEAWYFLHIAYARNEQKALSDYAKIEYLLLTGNHAEVLKILEKTQKALKKDQVKSLRLSDIEEQLKTKERD